MLDKVQYNVIKTSFPLELWEIKMYQYLEIQVNVIFNYPGNTM